MNLGVSRGCFVGGGREMVGRGFWGVGGGGGGIGDVGIG